MTKTVLSEALKQYCWQRNITTRDLAECWGCSHATVARFLNGEEVSQKVFMAALSWMTNNIEEES